VPQGTDRNPSLSGSSLSGPDLAPKTFSSGRVCAEYECGTLLSIYNESNYCSLHHPILTLRTRGKKVKRAA